MAAEVGVRETGDDNITAGGTFSGVESVPVQAGSTVLQSYGANGLNAQENMQGVGPATNFFQEVNCFVGEIANQITKDNPSTPCAPRAAWERIKAIGDQLFVQSFS